MQKFARAILTWLCRRTSTSGAERIFYLFIFLFVISSSISAQRHFWMPLNGPEGGIIHSIVSDNEGNIYASTGWSGANGSGAGRNGIYKSKDNGKTWEHIVIPFTHGREINCLEITDYDYIFAGSYFGGVYRSADGGESWEIVNGDILWGEVIDQIGSLGDSVIFARPRNGLIYKSTNRGASWSILDVANGLRFSHFGINKSTGRCYAYTVSNFYVSSDTGNHWTIYKDAFKYRTVQDYEFFGADTIFAATFWGDVFRSFDSGKTWSECNNGLSPDIVINSANILTRVEDLLFLGTQRNGIYMTSDFGNSWVPANNGLKRSEIRAISLINDSLIFAGTDGGVYISKNLGDLWIESNSGLDNSIVFALTFNSKGDCLYAGTSGGVLKSTDNGESWLRINDGLANHEDVLSLAVSDDNYLFAGISENGIFRSIDGVSWTNISNPSTIKSNITKILIDSSGIVYMLARKTSNSNYEGILRSTDLGITWTEVNTISPGQNFRDIEVNSKGMIFLATSLGAYYSSNLGNSWSIIMIDSLMNDDITVLHIDDNDYLYIGTQNPDIEIYRSTDDGMSWEFLDAFGIQYNTINDLEILNNSYGYAGVYGGAYEYTIDNNAWNYNALYQLSNGYSQTTFSLAIDNEGAIYAGTSAGIFINKPKNFFGESVSFCAGEIYTWNDQQIVQEGFYYDSLLSITGDDSIIQLTAIVHTTPNPFPVEGSVYVDAFTNVNYSTPYIPGNAYHWEVEGGEIVFYQSTNSIDVLWGNPGTGKVYLSVKNPSGCERDTSVNVNILTTGAHITFSNEEIKVKYNMHIAMLEVELNNIPEANLEVLSIDGRSVRSMVLHEGYNQFNFQYLNDGIYVICIQFNRGNYVERILKL